MYTNQ
jgi:hypothetical protein